MFERVTVAEDSDRGLVLGVPEAPGDPFAAVSLYFLGEAAGSAIARSVRDRLGAADLDVDVLHARGVLTLTASCPSEQVAALLATLADALSDTTTALPAVAQPEPDDPLRAALFEEQPLVDGVGPLVVAVTDGPTNILATAVKLLDSWPGRGRRRTVHPTTLRRRPLPPESTAAGEYTQVTFACPAPARDSPRYRATALAAAHLAAVDGPVSTQLRLEKSAAYTVAARVHPELGCGWLTVNAVIRRGACPNAADVIIGEVRRLAENPPDEGRVAALRARMTSRIERSLADNRGRCSDVTSGVLYGLPSDHQLEIAPGIAAVTREDVAISARALDLSRLIVREVALP